MRTLWRCASGQRDSDPDAEYLVMVSPRALSTVFPNYRNCVAQQQKAFRYKGTDVDLQQAARSCVYRRF